MSSFPLLLTEEAKKQMKIAMAGEKQGTFIRVAIQGGGCSGLQYKIDVETKQYDGDYAYDEDDLKVVVDGHSAVVLEGTTLDYATSFAGSGFTFTNPNAKKKCGCGNSFGV